MSFPATEFVDCLIIAKKFERGAIYATNEESVFAIFYLYGTTVSVPVSLSLIPE